MPGVDVGALGLSLVNTVYLVLIGACVALLSVAAVLMLALSRRRRRRARGDEDTEPMDLETLRLRTSVAARAASQAAQEPEPTAPPSRTRQLLDGYYGSRRVAAASRR